MQEVRESIKEEEIELGSFRLLRKKKRKECGDNKRYIQTMVEIFLFGLGRTKYVVHRRDSANRVVNLRWTRKRRLSLCSRQEERIHSSLSYLLFQPLLKSRHLRHPW